jgi:transcription elongation factor
MVERARNTTPEQMEANRRARRAERVAVRATSREVSFSAEAVEERLGLSEGMLLHMSQPYCRCSMGHDGIEFCEHAGDLGLTS